MPCLYSLEILLIIGISNSDQILKCFKNPKMNKKGQVLPLIFLMMHFCFTLKLFFLRSLFLGCSKRRRRGEMLSTVMYPSWVGDDLVVKLGNCYVRVLMSTCRQIDARQRQTTQESLFDTMKRREDIIQVNI